MKRFIQLLTLVFLSQTIYGQTQVGQTIFGENERNFCGSNIALSADGTRKVIGFKGLSLSPSFPDSGFVRVYELNNNIWEQIGSDIEGEPSDVGTGSTVSISADGNRIAFSAPSLTLEGVKGLVRVMEFDGNEWIQLGGFLSENDITNMFPNFGTSLSLSFDGNSIAITASSALSYAGKVYIYQYKEEEWVLSAELSGYESGQKFGAVVEFASGGNRIAIADNDFVRVFDWVEEAWMQVGDSIADNSSSFAFVDISMDGSRLVISNPAYYPVDTMGWAKVYEFVNATWTQIGETIKPTTNFGYFGASASISGDGDILVIGEPRNREGGNNGKVSIYNYNNGAWTLTGIPIFGDSETKYGESVFISLDGSKVAIGSSIYSEIVEHGGLTKVFKINDNSSSLQTVYSCESYHPPGMPDLIWTETGVYHYTLQNFNGSDSLLFVNLTVGSLDTDVTRTNATLEANMENATYQWLDCSDNYSPIAGTNTQAFTSVENGSFAVQIAQNGCIDTSACYEVILTNVEASISTSESIKIFPNPATNRIHVEGIQQGTKISIYDNKGKIVKQFLYNINGYDISELKTGMYHLSIENDDQIFSKKFIKH